MDQSDVKSPRAREIGLIAEFEIQGLPKLPNRMGYAHWRMKWAEARKWKALVAEMCTLLHIRDLKIKKAKLYLTRYSSNRPDDDGLRFGFKHTIDGLVQCGVIEDDAPEFMKAEYFWQLARPKHGKIKIRIEAA